MFPASGREPGNTGSHPRKPKTQGNTSLIKFLSSYDNVVWKYSTLKSLWENTTTTEKHLNYWQVVTNLLQGFSSPADGVHLPANLPLLLISEDAAERPRVRAAVSWAGDLVQNIKIWWILLLIKAIKPSFWSSKDEYTHLSSCGVITPLDVQLKCRGESWVKRCYTRNTDSSLVSCSKLCVCMCVFVCVREMRGIHLCVCTSAVSSMLLTSSMYAFISALWTSSKPSLREWPWGQILISWHIPGKIIINDNDSDKMPWHS